jgi:hypothetical protein
LAASLISWDNKLKNNYVNVQEQSCGRPCSTIKVILRSTKAMLIARHARYETKLGSNVSGIASSWATELNKHLDKPTLERKQAAACGHASACTYLCANLHAPLYAPLHAPLNAQLRMHVRLSM